MKKEKCYKVLTSPCQVFQCEHNVFYEGLSLPKDKKTKQPKWKETQKTNEILNCCCLIKDAWTLEEIGEAWGLSRERVRQIETNAIISLLKRALNQKEFSIQEFLACTPKEIQRKLNHLMIKTGKSK